MSSNIIINQVIILFIMMMAGFYGRKKEIIDSTINKALSEILLNVTLPLNIIAAFNFKYSSEHLYNMAIVFAFGVIIHPLSLLIGKILFIRFDKDKKNIMLFITMFSNCAFMGFPVLESIFGKLGVLYGSMYLAPFNFYIWTIGVSLFTGKQCIQDAKKNILNPGIISVILGLILFLFSVNLPYPIKKSFELIGGMTAPLSMMITGAVIADMHVKDIFSSISIYYISIIRLIVIPLISLIILKAVGLYGVTLGVCVIISAMPGAAMATVFAEKFNGNSAYSSQAVFISTILSLITIPIISFLI